tara:strand:- start:22 stop:282 length:261 start_codon:yes stop_codon:yes gene_type:complete
VIAPQQGAAVVKKPKQSILPKKNLSPSLHGEVKPGWAPPRQRENNLHELLSFCKSGAAFFIECHFQPNRFCPISKGKTMPPEESKQ